MVLRAAIRWQTGISEGGVCPCCVIQHLLASLSPLKIPAGSGPPSDTILADGTRFCRTKTPSTKHTYHWFHPTRRRLSYFQRTAKTTLTTGWGDYIYLWHSDRVLMLKGFLQTRDYIEEGKKTLRLGKKIMFCLENILEKVASNSGPLLGSRPQGVTPPPGPSPPDERSQVTYMQSEVVTLAQRHNTRLAFPSMALSKGCKIREY